MATVEFPASSFMKIVEMDGQMPSATVDIWHVAGDSVRHADLEHRDLKRKINDKLPRKDYQIEVGGTGYINWKSAIPFGDYGWTIDTVGRVVMVVGPYWCFQRYIYGDVLMIYHGNRLMSGDEVKKLDELVDNYKK